MESTAGFVHLHTHTMYSLLDGMIKPKKLIERAASWGMGAAAITDHGNMFGAVEFYLEAKKAGINPIIGSEVYVAIEGMKEKKAARGNMDGANHLVLLATSAEGYRNLMKISSVAYTEGFYYKPRVDKAFLRDHAAGLIALTACIKGEVPQLVIQGHPDEAERAARDYASIFGAENVFIEIQRHGIPEEDLALPTLVEIARATGLGLVATNDAHYLDEGQDDTHEVLLCISTGKTLDDPGRMHMETKQLWFKSPDEMKTLFADFPEATENTVRIAERCHVEIQTGVYHPVRFAIPKGFSGTADEYLTDIAEKGLIRRYGDRAPDYHDRLVYELGIIKKMGFSDYFLAIYDCTRAAAEMGIPVGTARGSAGGSVVAYAIGITNLDPMQYGLIFERFLNPERVSMPDFDVDYADRYRERMIDYVKETYGADHVCQIITFGTMAAKSAVKDAGRVLGIPFAEMNTIAKLIPGELEMTLDKAFEQVQELRDLEKSDDRYRLLFRHARLLEGLCRNPGTHAAGVIITPGPCSDYLPLSFQNDTVTSQYEMAYVEKVGCLKVDFLGLRTLTVIHDAVNLINETGGSVDIDRLPMDDAAVYDLMGSGDTVGVFQFESGGMRDYLRKLKPTCIDDLIAMNALYRPGPLGSNMVDDFIDRKHGRKPIRYLHPCLEDILKETYGVIVYQEQVMKVANVMAGFSLGAADELRRAMGKKQKDVMDKMRSRFIDGARENNVNDTTAGEVFDLMAHFAGYGFNKSHSAGYAILAYQTAWLKVYHFPEFMAASLTSEMDKTDRVVILIDECRSKGIEVLPPHVNSSRVQFTVEEGKVRFGLGAVKNVGVGAIEAIEEARREGGPFRDVFDFCERVESKVLNKRMIESLIMAGAFDGLGGDRAQNVAAIDDAVAFAQTRQRERDLGQTNLFGEASGDAVASAPSLPRVEPWALCDVLSREKSVLGFWLSGHPLEDHRDELTAFATPFRQLVTLRDRTPIFVGGVVTAVERKTTKTKNDPYLLVRMEDCEGTGDVMFMNGAFDLYKDSITVDSIILVKGTVSNRSNSDQPSVFAESVESLDDARKTRARGIGIKLATDELSDGDIDRILGVCQRYPGALPLWINLQTTTCGDISIKANRVSVSSDAALVNDLRSLLGSQAAYLL